MSDEPVAHKNQFVDAYSTAVAFFRPRITLARASWKKILSINAAVLVVTLAILFFFVKSYYTCTISILPDYGANAANNALSGLATLVTGGTGTPAEIYQSILSSETIMQPVLTKKRKTLAFKDSVSLIDYLSLAEPDASLPIEVRQRLQFLATFKKMESDLMMTNIDPVAKVLTVSVTLPESKLSANVVNDIVRSLENYVETKRQSNGKSQQIYIEKRLAQVSDSLKMFEDSLEIFQIQNRAIAQAPDLILEQNRLSRSIQLVTAVYSQLITQLEMAKIQEIQDTPILNVQEFAQDPIVRTGPKRLIDAIIVMVLSLFFTSAFYGFKSELNEIWRITVHRENA